MGSKLKVILRYRGCYWTGAFSGRRRIWTRDRQKAAVFSERNKIDVRKPAIPVGAQLVNCQTGKAVLERLA